MSIPPLFHDAGMPGHSQVSHRHATGECAAPPYTFRQGNNGFDMVSGASTHRFLYAVDDHPFDRDAALGVLRHVESFGGQVSFVCFTPPFPVISGAAGAVCLPLAEENRTYELGQAELARDQLSRLASLAADQGIRHDCRHIRSADFCRSIRDAAHDLDACCLVLEGSRMTGRLGDRAVARLARKLAESGVSVLFAGQGAGRASAGLARRTA